MKVRGIWLHLEWKNNILIKIFKNHHLHWKKKDVICSDKGGPGTMAVGRAGSSVKVGVGREQN